MKKINVIAISLLCNYGCILTMHKMLKETNQVDNKRGIFVKEDTSFFLSDKSKNILDDFKKKRVCDPESFRASGPAVTHGLPWRDIPKASLLLSMPVITLMAGTIAYEYGLPLVMSAGCSFGTAISYLLILEKILR